jgi:adenylate kinase family enzyme
VGPRINVKGASGSGKTTLASALPAQLGVAHVELDGLHHGPNWSEPSDTEFQAGVQSAVDAHPGGWGIDGNDERKLGRLVTDAADLVVWLDLPLPLLLVRVMRRTTWRIVGKVELWNGNRESWRDAIWGRDALIPWAIRAHVRHRREWPSRFGSHPGFVRLRSSEAVRRWLQQQH